MNHRPNGDHPLEEPKEEGEQPQTPQQGYVAQNRENAMHIAHLIIRALSNDAQCADLGVAAVAAIVGGKEHT